jgi:hypothetical protein
MKIQLCKIITLILLMATLSACHPWFRMGPGAPADQEPILTSSESMKYFPGTPSWIPLIDQCITAGDDRNTCIENLPPDEKEKFDEWERERLESRRRLLEFNRQQQ